VKFRNVRLMFEAQFDAQRPATLLQNMEQALAADTAETVAAGADHLSAEMNVDVIPMRKSVGDAGGALRIGRVKRVHRLIGKDHAPAERVIRPVALDDENLVAPVQPFECNCEVKTRGPAAYAHRSQDESRSIGRGHLRSKAIRRKAACLTPGACIGFVARPTRRTTMKPFFVQIKCKLGQTYRVAEHLIDTVEETAEIYSVTGAYDLLAKFHLANDQSFGEFVNFKLHTVDGIRDTFSLVAFRLFCVPDPDNEGMDETDFRKLVARGKSGASD
jgi:DNA-binding Lrp family transcriptional regulator